ncbi:MAG: hypothetical protein ACTSU5_03385 [Promethearchaeota archaeon]
MVLYGLIPLVALVMLAESWYLIHVLRWTRYVQLHKVTLRRIVILAAYLVIASWPLFLAEFRLFSVLGLTCLSLVVVVLEMRLDRKVGAVREEIRAIVGHLVDFLSKKWEEFPGETAKQFRAKVTYYIVLYACGVGTLLRVIPVNIFVVLVAVIIFRAILLSYINREEKQGKISIKWRFYTTLFLIGLLVATAILAYLQATGKAGSRWEMPSCSRSRRRPNC